MCENAQAEALKTDDFGEVAVFGHLAGFGGLFRLELLFGMLFCMPNTADGFDGAHGDLAQEVLDLGEDLLDRVQVRRVFRQEEELGAGGADELAYGFGSVTAEIVHDYDVAGMKCGDEDLFDIGPEALTVDGTSNSRGAVMA